MTEASALALEFSLSTASGVEKLADEARLGDLAASVLTAEGVTGSWEIAVALVTDDELQALHLRFMNIDEPTDIMTFPYGVGMLGGDLAISADHARARASEWGNTPAQEVEFLVAHGVLHLLGWNDTSPEERAAMLKRQEVLVSEWRAAAGA